ncbi:hypothetical protein BXZ70DRAFT_973798 [Cristinia sonorae]|uniref:Phytocyanin domain-containing protein n=1 Tax=Cristinia sonorae TaxID=1940300 RepID=A0A8K0UM68_9AGAR|nr:hypothetical protein BXZ70DRAFT_973798 [Cristinia sonorae]
MVFIAPFVGAVTLFASLAAGLPRPDSALGEEVAVSAPNGIVLSDTVELASQLASEAAASTSAYYAAATTTAAAAAGTTYYAGSYSAPAAGAYGYVASSSAAAAAYTYAASSAADYTYAAPSSAAAYTYAPPPAATYGSGYSNWQNSDGYNNCVQQCVASFGAPPAMYTPPPSATTDAPSSGSGATHTVIVAPTQGVLRYVPFAVNASVGDTVRFVWNANNHTVTKSSALTLCNKTSDKLFVSGTHDKGFIFDQVVNDTAPTFYYCGTPGHCQKGMFGVINPPSLANANTSVGMQMSSLVSANPDLADMSSYVNKQTSGNLKASTWGQNIDLAGLPDWSHRYVAENVLYARTFMAQNPDVINPDGSINMETNAPLMFPVQLAANNAAAAASSTASSAAASATSAAAAPTGSSAPSGSGYSSGAGKTAVSGGVLAVVVLVASFLAL